MILIGQYDSPFVRRVAIALHLYGMPFAHRPWSAFSDAAALGVVNPLMRVPTLVLDSGEVLVDSVTILDHLDEAAGDAALLPRTGAARRAALRQMALALGVADKAVALFYERRMHAQVADAWQARLHAQITATLAMLDQSLQTEWFAATMTHADIAMACCWRFLADAHPALGLWAYPALSDHATRLEATPVFRDIRQAFVPPP
jgi:glutathione S-transferase